MQFTPLTLSCSLWYFAFYAKTSWSHLHNQQKIKRENLVLSVRENNLKGLKNRRKNIPCCGFFFFFFFPLKKYDIFNIMNLGVTRVFCGQRLDFSLKTLRLIARPLVSALLKTTPWTNQDPKRQLKVTSNLSPFLYSQSNLNPAH